MLVKTSELIGSALDWAVAKSDGLPLSEEACQDDFILIGTGCGDLERFSPSTDWSQGGPLIDKFAPLFTAWRGQVRAEVLGGVGMGDTYLIAACRAIVAAKLGDQVDVPDDLMQS